MLRKTSILVITAMLFSATDTWAWSWKDAVQQAVDKNPTLLSQKRAAEIAELREQNATSLMYPMVDLEGGFRGYQDQTRKFRHQIFLGPTAQYLIYQGGRTRAGVRVSEAQNTQAELNVRVNSVAVNARLRRAFAVALREKKYVDLSHRIEEQRKENLKFTKIRYDSGLEYKWVFLSSNVKWQQATLDVQLAEMNKQTALADLENVLGKLPIDSVLAIDENDFYKTDTDYELDPLLAAIVENPRYKLLESNVVEALANVKYNEGALYPRIAINTNLGMINTERQELFPFHDDTFVPYWTVGASLYMPLYEGKRNRRNVDIAKAQVIQRNFDLEQAKLDLIANLKKNYQTYIIAKKQVEISQLNSEATMDRSKVVSNQYKAGLTSFLDWESSQDGWVSAEIQLLNDTRDFQIARSRLEEAMGVELGEGQL